MNKSLDERVAELERRVTECPAADPEINEKAKRLILAYLDCAIKAAEGFVSGNLSGFKDDLYCLNDAVRMLHHIRKMTKDPELVSTHFPIR